MYAGPATAHIPPSVPLTAHRPSQNAGLEMTVISSWSSNAASIVTSSAIDGACKRQLVGYVWNVRFDVHGLVGANVTSSTERCVPSGATAIIHLPTVSRVWMSMIS